MWQSKHSTEIEHLPNSVSAAQLTLLAESLSKDMLLGVAATAIIGLYLIPGEPHWLQLSIWMASFCILGIVGVPLSHFIKNAAKDALRVKSAERLLTVYAGLLCALWSSLILLYWQVHEIERLIVISALVALGNVPVTTTLMLYRPAMVIAFVCINLPILVKLMLSGTMDQFILALILIGAAGFFFRAGWNGNRHLTEALTLRHENRNLVAKLNHSLADANYANAAKSRFLASVSHQLRTPLNAIIGFSELIQQKVHGPLGDDRYDNYITDIVESSDRLLAMINDILDLTKLESGELEPIDEPFRLHDVLEQTISQHISPAQHRDITLTLASPDSQIELFGDRKHVVQILTALLSNAIKFSSPGQEVIISVHSRDNGDLEIAVIDCGIGMSAEMAGRVLSPFEKNDKSGTQLGAMGLGLPLAKALAELQDASIEISSDQEKGTTACLIWPSEKIINDPAKLPAHQRATT